MVFSSLALICQRRATFANEQLGHLQAIMITALVAMMGLLPKLLSDGTGAEIQRPLATVVFGGLLTATSMTLLVLPTLYLLLNRGKN